VTAAVAARLLRMVRSCATRPVALLRAARLALLLDVAQPQLLFKHRHRARRVRLAERAALLFAPDLLLLPVATEASSRSRERAVRRRRWGWPWRR
jgi:hypothetical protein